LRSEFVYNDGPDALDTLALSQHPRVCYHFQPPDYVGNIAIAGQIPATGPDGVAFPGHLTETYSGEDVGFYLQDAIDRLQITDLTGYIEDGTGDIMMTD
jgi:hypothetical protein